MKGDMDVAQVLSSASWQIPASAAAAVVAGGAIPTEAWRKLLAAHLRLAVFVCNGDVNGGRSNGAPNGGRGGIMNVLHQQPHPHPLHCAASQGIIRAGIALIQSRPSDINVQDASGRTPLHWASMANHDGFVQMLVEAGAATDSRDSAGRTPLMSSCAYGATAASRVLLQWGAHKDAQDFMGLTPLHAAAAGGHVEVAEVLLLAGADHQRRASVGASPRNVAERQGHSAVVDLLTNRGKGPCSGDARGKHVGVHYTFDRHSLLNRRRIHR